MAMNFKFNILPILNKSEARWKKFAKRIKFPNCQKSDLGINDRLGCSGLFDRIDNHRVVSGSR